MLKETSAKIRMRCAVPFWHEHLHPLAQQFGSLITKESFNLCIHETDQALIINHDHRAGSSFDYQPEAFIGSLALTDVDDTGEHERATFGLDGIQSDFNWNFGAVFPQSVKIAACAHRSRHR